MTKTLKWRLKEPPTPLTLGQLVKDQLLTKDEAREILFSSETEEDRDKKSLESEIKFLRELVEKLSSGSSTRIVEVIREVQRPYYVTTPWYQPYQVWCTNLSNTGGSYSVTTTAGNTTNAINTAMLTGTNTGAAPANASFSSIKTF